VKRIVALVLSATIIAGPAAGEEFDRSLLRGRWVELFGDEKPSCSNALVFEHELNADGTILTTRYVRNWLLSELSGNRISEESMRVVQMTRDTLVVRRDGDSEPGVPVEWEMLFVSPDMYRLRADGWQTEEGDFVRRQRCP
jgi:hypothetical protein